MDQKPKTCILNPTAAIQGTYVCRLSSEQASYNVLTDDFYVQLGKKGFNKSLCME